MTVKYETRRHSRSETFEVEHATSWDEIWQRAVRTHNRLAKEVDNINAVAAELRGERKGT